MEEIFRKSQNLYTTIFVKFIDMDSIHLFYAPAQIEKWACAIWNFQPKLKIGQASFLKRGWLIVALYHLRYYVRPPLPTKN
ncbi:hypothetical protein AGR7A_pAt20128 [Agrobacterium deltaense NCPPB 1641]|uniref:Uncharacterized protein n=1 Tax=Agrobacterium deltaense NCPPB 1641 TaxID=1183425 RepID=A0A1S7U8U5_9HYPH|nr:hypothetical protein AGR7A_pAt20128 [Agrobacterium deltaense NCPPB 1641]